MSDKIVSRNGETVEIDSIISALEATPDKAEILDALKTLRAEKVRDALSQTVKASQFNLSVVFNEYLADGDKSTRTQQTYGAECTKLFGYLDRAGIHPLQTDRAEINRFKAYLLERYAANTVRLTLAACSSFYTYLADERYIERSPFTHVSYPKKVYKKAVQPDQGSPVPVMNDDEYNEIIIELDQRSTGACRTVQARRKRDSSRRLFSIIHFMGMYGLRVSDTLTVRFELNDRFSVTAKGGTVRSFALSPETVAILKRTKLWKREPFKGIALSTVQGAIRKLMISLVEEGVIRHRYSAHDFRHYFAVSLYRETRDVYRVKEALGHAAISVTEVYLAGLGAT